MRQCPDRYSIRAGRNLPDKEFRYLRTVIVTAAVHWGFGLELRLPYGELTPPLNLPAPGRSQTLYVVLCDLAESCVFVKQSPEPLQCHPFTPHIAGRKTLLGYPFFRSYGVSRPSSLTRVLSSALGFSPHLPESVCGTDTLMTHIGVFLASVESAASPVFQQDRHHLSGLTTLRVYLEDPPTSLDPDNQSWDSLSFCVTP